MDFLPLLVQPVSWQLLRILWCLDCHCAFWGAKKWKLKQLTACSFYSFGFMSIWVHKTASFTSY